VPSPTRVLSATLGGLAAVTLLAGCLPAAPSAPEPAAPAVSEPAPEPVEEKAPAAAGDGPEWAKPTANVGEKIATITGDGFQVEVYQVGVTQATKTGQFVTPDGVPVISPGDDIVFVNYVITNTSGGDIALRYSLVAVDATYASWPYLQGMDSVVDGALFEQMQVHSGAIAPGSGDSPFIWPAGTTFSYGQNFLYEKNGPITFEATLTPALPNGDLDHDKRQVVSADGVIS